MFRYSSLTLSSLSFSLAADSARPGQMKQSDEEKVSRKEKKTIAPTFHWLRKKLGVKKREKTKNKTWSSFVVSLHPSFMFIKRKAKAGGC